MREMKRALEELALRHGVRIDVLEEVGSTNDAAREPVYGHGDVVLAESQTRGRGQRGNHWESAPGENLTFSVVLRPDFLPAARQFLLSEAVALAVSDMLLSYGLEARIKWPNDIYAGNRKVTGILIENDLRGGMLARSIAGIGIDVNQRRFGSWIPNPSSMALLTGREIDRGKAFTRFYEALAVRFAALRAGRGEEIARDYHERLYLRDTPHPFRLPDGTVFTGIIRRAEPAGDLKVEHPDGSVRAYLFKEIEYL